MITGPITLIAVSNLTSNVGLSPNVELVELSSTVNNYNLVKNFANLQPGTTNGNVLSARSFSVVNLGLPLYIANANITIANVSSHYSKMLPSIGGGKYNVQTFSSLLNSSGSFIINSNNIAATLEQYKDAEFNQLGVNVTDYTSAITNGISSVFGGGESDPALVQANIGVVADALAKFGTAYDIKRVSEIHKPSVFIDNLLTRGFYNVDGQDLLGYPLPENWRNLTDQELLDFLDLVDEFSIQKVISQTGISTSSVITSLSQLLELKYVVSPEALALIPGHDFPGLANAFLNLGGSYKSFNDLAQMLSTIEVPDIAALEASSELLPDSVYTDLRSKLGSSVSGSSITGITDMLGSVAGVTHNNALTVVNECLDSALSYSVGQNLNSAMVTLANYCTTGNVTLINLGITQLWQSANAFNAESNLSSVRTTGNAAIAGMLNQVGTELNNLSLAGISLSSVSGSSNDVISLVNNLYRYGADDSYSTLLHGVASENQGGAAIRACLAETKNYSAQTSRSVKISSRST